MTTVSQILKGMSFAAASLAFANAAFATEVQTPADPADVGEAELLSEADMESLAGGTGVSMVITNQTLNATNQGNTINGDVVSSGQVSIGSGAFSGYDGVGNFVINTGHQNNLQSTISVGVTLTPSEGQ
jgi:hypothetical protein